MPIVYVSDIVTAMSPHRIGCSKKNCRGFPLNTPTIEHIETQTRYYLIEVDLYYILVYDFLFFH